MNALGKPHGSIGRASERGITSPAYWVLRARSELDSQFAHHLLRSQWMVQQLAGLGKNLPPNQFDIPWETFRQIEVTLPSIAAQRRIADFLDDRVARIDRIIAARRKQIDALALVREARIQQLQDDLAARHGDCRLAYLLAGLEQGWSPQADSTPASASEWGVMRSGCVNGGHFRSDDNKRLPDGLKPRIEYEIHPGDLLMSRASGSLELIGSTAVVPETVRQRLLLCDKIYRLSPAGGHSVSYLAHMLRTRRSREQIRIGVSGAEGMANNLPSSVVCDLQIPMVPRGQQAKVVDLADEVLRDEAQTVTGFRRSLELLTEFKSSLITAAVTGELDVTTAGSGIPG